LHTGPPALLRRAGTLAIILFVVVLLLVPTLDARLELSSPVRDGAGPSELHPASGLAPVVITDGETISVPSPVNATLNDSISYGTGTGGARSYAIHLTVSRTILNLSIPVQVDTYPIVQWGLPNQLPGGGDSLPPLSLWEWTVWDGTSNLTTTWTATMWDQLLWGVVAWGNQTIWIRGTTDPQVTVQVDPTETDGTYAPGVGFVMNTPGVAGAIPTNDSTFTSTAAALHPQLVRFSTTMAEVSLSWDNETNEPRFNFTYFDALYRFARAVGAEVLLNLPAGTWGDGNLLPTGMPVNRSVIVPGDGLNGFLPNDTAWASYVGGLVNHTASTGETITYWSIGNEFPTDNQTLVSAFTNIFNIAERTIHDRAPHARVGTDVMTNSTFEPYFATHAHDVGFLSFHYYASIGVCVVNGTYCPPEGDPNGSTDEQLFSHSAYAYFTGVNPPSEAADLWHAATGEWLPMINAETNLGSYGGSYGTYGVGTDPRTQTLFGAAWTDSLLIDSAEQNVSDIAYFTFSSGWGIPNTLTAPYGGFGFGLTAEAANRTNTLYAPYYALELWGKSIPAGAPGLATNSSAPLTVYSYAAMDGANLSVVLVNRANVPVSVAVNVTSGNFSLASVSTLDQRSYDEVYEASKNMTVIKSAGLALSHPGNESSVLLDGYGVAVATYSTPSGDGTGGGNGTHNSTGNGTGNGTGNSTGSGGGNSTGNGTGTGGNQSASGNATGNRTGNSTLPVGPDPRSGSTATTGIFADPLLEQLLSVVLILALGALLGVWVGWWAPIIRKARHQRSRGSGRR
jgi:hypothetical protein